MVHDLALIEQMFEDIRQFTELRALTFSMGAPPPPKPSAAAAAPKEGAGNRGGFYRPWADDQHKGYIDYTPELWWDHG